MPRGKSNRDALAVMRDAMGKVQDMTQALEMIAQGYVYRGSERQNIDAEDMRVIALKALGKR